MGHMTEQEIEALQATKLDRTTTHCSKKAGQDLSMCEIVVMRGHRNQPARS